MGNMEKNISAITAIFYFESFYYNKSIWGNLQCFQMLPPEKYKTTREYHGIVRGYILNEIFRRVEPSGRTMGEYLRSVSCGLTAMRFNIIRVGRGRSFSVSQGGDRGTDGG